MGLKKLVLEIVSAGAFVLASSGCQAEFEFFPAPDKEEMYHPSMSHEAVRIYPILRISLEPEKRISVPVGLDIHRDYHTSSISYDINRDE